MNIPNFLTFLRILLVPLFVILLIYDYTFYAFLAFIVASITDAVDGMIARLFNQKTTLGAYLDPVADKLLLVTSYVVLAVIDIIPSWLTVVVISRDVIILIGIAVSFLNHKPLEIRPSILGKASTLFQIVTVVVALSSLQPFPALTPLIPYSIYLTALFTVLSGFHYTYIWVRKMA